MKRAHAGFTLIELIIAIALSSIVSLVLINALYQMSRFRAMVDERVSIYSHVVIIQQQMERDITSAFIPDLVKTSTKSQEKGEANQASENKQVETQAESEKGEAQKQRTNSAEQNEPEQKDSDQKKWFYGVKAGESFDLLTCITTSPLPVYWGTKSGKPRARIARVVYRLQHDPARPDSYILYRQEGAELDFASYKENGSRNFVVAKDIKSMMVSYEAEIKNKKPEDKNSLAGTAPAGGQAAAGAGKNKEQSEQESVPEYKLFPEWDSDKIGADAASHSERPFDTSAAQKLRVSGEEPHPNGGEVSSRTPHTVTIELRLWNPEHTHDRLFKFVYTVVWQDTKNKASSTPSPQPTAQTAGQAGTSSPSATPTTAPNSAKNSTASLFAPQGKIVARGHNPARPGSRPARGATAQAEPAADMLVQVITEKIEIVGV